MSAGPLIVQSDHTLLLEVDHPGHADARNDLLGFAELVKSPEHVHTYRLTPLSVWNARAAGLTADRMVEALEWHARFPPPANVVRELREQADRYGRLRLVRRRDAGFDEDLRLTVDSASLADQLARTKGLDKYLTERDPDNPAAFVLDPAMRGQVKQALIKAGYPAEDYAGYTGGTPLDLRLRETTRRDPGRPFALRPYQRRAVDAFLHGPSAATGPEAAPEDTDAAGHGSEPCDDTPPSLGGSGVIVLPCGAGKTVIGIAALAAAGTRTLILAPSTTAVRQWIDELLDKTTLEPHQIAEYSGSTKDIAEVTVATYQILTGRKSKDAAPEHLQLFDREDWGLIVYDEVHLLPAPVFAVTATIQSRRRLGLTATLVREDGRESDVFALIGPKKADVPWKTLEAQGWIAKARCTEVRVPMPEALMRDYHAAQKRAMFRVASGNPAKIGEVKRILRLHPNEPALVIGMYVEQLSALADELDAPLITGSTGQRKRDELFDRFRKGELSVLVVSKVANFAIDLPDAALAVQVSGTFGSRQEEAQRLGRLLRPKRARPGGTQSDADANQARFYSLVSRDTNEQDFALNRQLFLCEQGYRYRLVDAEQDDAVLIGAEDG